MLRASLLLLLSTSRAFVARRAPRSACARLPARLPDASAEDLMAVYGEGAVCEGVNGVEEHIFGLNEKMVDVVKGVVDLFFQDRDYARFYALETLARVPYFAYVCVLHFRETFGHRAEDHVARVRVHFAEADNELHHLLVMEELGGGDQPLDRAFAQTLAFGYFFYVAAVYAAHPRAAYHLSEVIEAHAHATYSAFLEAHGDELKHEPVPAVARRYYEEETAMFDLGGRAAGKPPRRPRLKSLYDVFANIRDDEHQHWEALTGYVQYDNPVLPGPAESTRPCVATDDGCVVEAEDCPVPVYSR